MNKTKQGYVAPLSDLLVVRFEENLLTLSTQGNTIQNATIDAWEDEL